MIELTMPFPPKALSPNARVFWAVKANAVQAYREGCYWRAREQYGVRPSTPLATPVTAYTTFVVTTARKRDEDNLIASTKAMWDALVDFGLLAGDDAAVLHHAPIAIEKGREACVRVRLEAAS